MAIDDRDLLDVLKFELNFLEKGGYSSSPREPWRAPRIFEDSPACMNYDAQDNPAPCKECALIDLVPLSDRRQPKPCRHIPLTKSGDTLETLYRWSSEPELEDTYGMWLRATIARIEEEREQLCGVRGAAPPVWKPV
jgi:hypothetical protein